jgi:hypothetical protein
MGIELLLPVRVVVPPNGYNFRFLWFYQPKQPNPNQMAIKIIVNHWQCQQTRKFTIPLDSAKNNVYSLPMVPRVLIPRYLFCLFLCTAAPPTGFSIYIFINTTDTFIESSGHSVQMSWIFVSTRIFIFSLEIADIFILPWYHAL